MSKAKPVKVIVNDDAAEGVSRVLRGMPNVVSVEFSDKKMRGRTILLVTYAEKAQEPRP